MNISQKNTPFFILTAATFIGLIWPILIQDGMFADGMLYTCVAHNLSQGVGTFWFPQFSAHNIAGLSSFHEQPPLIFGIQAIFFKVLGSSMYVERFYTALTSIIAALLIGRLWFSLNKDNEKLKKLVWLPVLLWITVESTFWSYRSNMQENTMTIFCLLAVIAIYNWASDQKLGRLFFASVLIAMAALSKGVPGLFPTVVPALYAITTRKISIRKGVIASLIITVVVAVFFLALLLFDESRKSLSLYFFQRLVQRVNEVPVVDNRFFIIVQFFKEQLVQVILVVLVLLFKKSRHMALPNSRQALFLFSVAFAGSLPLALTLVQRTFYYVPSLPFFALGSALLLAPLVSEWIDKMNSFWKKALLTISLLALSGALGATIYSYGKTSRDQEVLYDVYEMGKIIPRGSTVSVPHELWNRWELQCYLMRYFSISVEDSQEREYFLTDKDVGKVPVVYLPIDGKMYLYRVFRKQQVN
jgi:hypothetical protein